MAKEAGPSAKSRSWKQNPDAVRDDILRAAQAEFARHGLSRTRVEDIAARTKTSKRMIFYYFGDKESLYQAVLRDAYAHVRKGEAALNVEDLPPVEALKRLVEFTFDHHSAHPDFIRLVMVENIHDGRHMGDRAQLAQQNARALEVLERILAAGTEAGLFRPGVDPLMIHWQISAASFFNMSNRRTFEINFGDSLFSREGQAALRAQVARAILSLVLTPEALTAFLTGPAPS